MNQTTRTLTLLAAALAALALPAAARGQTSDSALAVSSGGQSLFRVNVNGTAFFGGSYNSGVPSGVPVEGSGVRMFWYPGKAAFRAGSVEGTQWDDANIGLYSVALGLNSRALGDYSMAMGWKATSANSGTIALGEDVTATGVNSVVLGYKASTSTEAGSPRLGTFVFGDRSTTVDTIHAEVTNSATWRVANGFRIYTNSNRSTGFHVLAGMNGSFSWSGCSHTSTAVSTSTCAYLSSGGTWTNSSDVNRKHQFEDVSGEQVLIQLSSVPIRSWSYRAEPQEVRHIGPTAQDFRAAFGLGVDERSISTVDADGVALAAAQALTARTDGLRESVTRLREENAALRGEVTTLQTQNAALEARLRRVEEMLATQAQAPHPQR